MNLAIGVQVISAYADRSIVMSRDRGLGLKVKIKIKCNLQQLSLLLFFG